MEPRKQKEIEYYEKQAEILLKSAEEKQQGDFEKFSPFLLKSYTFVRNFLKNKCNDKKVLDYGCGNGVHSVWLAQYGGEITGIDLSKKSLQIAKEKLKTKKMDTRTEFLVMDCENLEFPDNYFDIIFDGGTFSSLDLKKVFSELSRVLKPNGFLIGIETLGHNPFTNLKRRINKLSGKRTEWAVHHIFRMEDLKKAEEHFKKTEAYFFHLISWIVFPALKLPGGKVLLKLFEKIDGFLIFLFPFLKRYSFKIVFIFSQPLPYKNDEKII